MRIIFKVEPSQLIIYIAPLNPLFDTFVPGLLKSVSRKQNQAYIFKHYLKYVIVHVRQINWFNPLNCLIIAMNPDVCLKN